MNKKQKIALYVLTPVVAGLALAGSVSANTISTNTTVKSNLKGFKNKIRGGEGIKNNTALAGILGITSTELQTALQSGKTIDTLIAEKGLNKSSVMQSLRTAHELQLDAQLKADIASGKLTQAQADKIKTDRALHETNHKTSLANVLGISIATLEAEVQAGRTIAELAAAHGLTEDALKSKIDATRDVEMRAEIAARVASGKLTQAQADSIVTNKGKGGKRGFAGEHGPRGTRSAHTITTK